jgi:hypothetical protein
VQALILLEFLLSLSPSAKDKLAALEQANNKSVLYPYTLSAEDVSLNSRRTQIFSLAPVSTAALKFLHLRMIHVSMFRLLFAEDVLMPVPTGKMGE